MPSSNLFQYSRLKSPTHIRILHIAAAEYNHPLYCTIEEVNLQDNPRYKALSYVWGSNLKPYRLLIGDTEHIPITASLYQALRDLRSFKAEDTFRTLWADAVSINQDDLDERAQQVGIMSSIYRQAQCVMTYMGEEADESAKGIRLAWQLYRHAQEHVKEPPDPRMLQSGAMPSLGFPDALDPAWEGLRLVLRRAWSFRAWIVQESVLCKEAYMVCGRTMMPWMLLPYIVDFTTKRRLPYLVLGGMDTTTHVEPHHVWDMGLLRQRAWEQGNLAMPILEWLRKCHKFKCSDPRDKVYSLLGIANDHERLALDISYTASVASVYSQLAIRVLQTHNSLSLLSNVHAKKSIELPSWVPDWSSCPQFWGLPLSQQDIYKTSKDTYPCFEIDTEHYYLNLDGAVVGTISYVSDPLYPPLAMINKGECYSWLEAQHSLIATLEGYPTGEEPIDVFWKTLIGNRTHDHMPLPEDYGRCFEGYLTLALSDAGRPVPQSQDEDNSLELGAQFLKAMSDTGLHRCLGAVVPFVIRQAGDMFEHLGECYVHGLMSGEALDWENIKIQRLMLR